MYKVLAMAFALTLAACTPNGSNTTETVPVTLSNTSNDSRYEFTVEVADTQEAQMRGLMQRDDLKPDEGMLFVFDEAKPRSFWMKDTIIPLDIFYFNSNKTLIRAMHMPPCTKEPCPTYPSGEPAQYVLEVPGGVLKNIDRGLEWKLVIQ